MSSFYSEGNFHGVGFLFYLLEKQDMMPRVSSSSSCFSPPSLVRCGTVYCPGEYFMTRASRPQGRGFKPALTQRMNKWEESTGESAGESIAVVPSTVESDGQVRRPPVQNWTQPGGVTDSCYEGHQLQRQLTGSCQLKYCPVFICSHFTLSSHWSSHS